MVAWPLEQRCLKERAGAESEMRPVAKNKRAGLAGQMQLGGGNQIIQSCAILSRLTKNTLVIQRQCWHASRALGACVKQDRIL